MSGTPLLDEDDSAFVRRWWALSVDERGALPGLEQALARKRYASLTAELASEPPMFHVEQSEPRRGSATPIPGFTTAAIWEGFEPPGYLVRDLIAPGELTVLYGASGHFKSVIAIDLALSIGAGVPFQGRKTRRGGVLYVAGEGHGGIRKRLRAWLLSRGYDSGSDQPWVYVTSSGADLISEPDRITATAQEAAQALGAPIDLVVIDTLAANFGAGDEYHARDMGLAISGARMAGPGTAVLLVHHIGHGQSDRERGSYALVAAADVRVQATYEESTKVIELAWRKLKDDERPEPALFNWRKVALEWEDEEGQELTSVVLDPLEGERPLAPAPVMPRGKPTGRNQETALRVLKTLLVRARKNVAERGDDPDRASILIEGWRTALEAADKGFNRNRFREVWASLQASGQIIVEGAHVKPFFPVDNLVHKPVDNTRKARPNEGTNYGTKSDRNDENVSGHSPTEMRPNRTPPPKGGRETAPSTPSHTPPDRTISVTSNFPTDSPPLRSASAGPADSEPVEHLGTSVATPSPEASWFGSSQALDEYATSLGLERHPLESDDELHTRLEALKPPGAGLDTRK